MSKEDFVIHFCKNGNKPEFIYPEGAKKGRGDKGQIPNPEYCNSCFISEDYTNVQSLPPTYLYCPKCVAQGYKNPRRTKRVMSEAEKEAFKERMKRYREGKKHE